MSRDEHGMPVPSENSPLPWKQKENIHGSRILCDSRGLLLNPIDHSFAIHAANWIIPCQEIVRELAECHPSDWDMVATKAKKLWDEMLKGAVDEQA